MAVTFQKGPVANAPDIIQYGAFIMQMRREKGERGGASHTHTHTQMEPEVFT